MGKRNGFLYARISFLGQINLGMNVDSDIVVIALSVNAEQSLTSDFSDKSDDELLVGFGSRAAKSVDHSELSVNKGEPHRVTPYDNTGAGKMQAKPSICWNLIIFGL